jgi:predicted GH43/DUF377 family glycosyl hydrolase
LVLLMASVVASPCDCRATDESKSITLVTHQANGLGREAGVCRRDPSDVIRVGDKYYVWYSKVTKGAPLYPSGYFATVWYATSTDEGRHWTEQGEAIDKGAPGAFDSFGVFTPNILMYDQRYYLYYTAVGDGFINRGYTEQGQARIAVAVAKTPDGPWTKPENNVVIEPAADHNKFDSFRCDDSCLLVRDGRIWLYYKGRAWAKTPGETKMGVAVAQNPLGPFVKQNAGNPVQPEGHEVAVWAQSGGVVSLVTNVGRGVYFSKDGIRFRKIPKTLKGNARAPGGFRLELTAHTYDQGIHWGISMVHARDPFLVRWTVELPDSTLSDDK